MSISSTTTGADLIEAIHPGEILMEDFIEVRRERRVLRDKVAAIAPWSVA